MPFLHLGTTTIHSRLWPLLLAAGPAGAVTIPDGFHAVAETDGAVCYRKDYPGGQPDFVVVVDLDRARVDSMVGDVTRAGSGEGPLGGDNPSFRRLSLRTFWDRARGADGQTFAVVNGQFFANTAAGDAPLAFSVHSRDRHISDGYGITAEFPGQKELVLVDNDANDARIPGWNADVFRASGGADHRVAALDVEADKGPSRYTGRTFVGAHDEDGDGRYETFMIFASSYANQPGAAQVLRDFGATELGMLDGGGSTQLIVDGNDLVASSRTIPHVLVVASDPPPPCSDECDGGRRCDGADRWQECGDHDGDPCREWGGGGACGDGERCEGGGVCATVPPPDAGPRDAGSTDGGTPDAGQPADVAGGDASPDATPGDANGDARGPDPAGADAGCGCAGRACGVDPCGVLCGACAPGERCDERYMCVPADPEPGDVGRDAGDDRRDASTADTTDAGDTSGATTRTARTRGLCAASRRPPTGSAILWLLVAAAIRPSRAGSRRARNAAPTRRTPAS